MPSIPFFKRNEKMFSLSFVKMSGLLSILSTSVSSAFIVLDVVSLGATNSSSLPVAIVSTSFHFLSLICLCIVSFVRACGVHPDRSGWSNLLISCLVLLPGITAACCAFVTLAMISTSDKQVTGPSGQDWDFLLPAGFVTCSIMTIAQLVFFLICLIHYGPLNRRAQDVARTEMQERIENQTMPKSQGFLAQDTQTSRTPTVSTISIHSTKSWPSSVHQILKISSKTWLVGSRGSESRDSHASSEIEESMDVWDLRPGLVPLTPIPGSRPLTPAANLEEVEGLGTDRSSSPEQFVRRKCSQCPSSTTMVDESNIHPLFRSDTPDPPPVASPGTVLTASPHFRQPITAERAQRSRSRSNSRVGSSLAFSSPSSRSPSPPSREMTPPLPEVTSPIPGFIHSKSSRDSFSEHGKRKEAGYFDIRR